MDASEPPGSLGFSVRGMPQTQGSKVARHVFDAGGQCKVWLAEDFKAGRLTEWRALVATAAKHAMGHRMPFVGPVRVLAAFYFPRPASHTRAQLAGPYVAVRGRYDTDKLVRALFDAMTSAAVWQDDGQVAVLETEKRYAEPGAPIGVIVAVEPVHNSPLFEATL